MNGGTYRYTLMFHTEEKNENEATWKEVKTSEADFRNIYY